MGAVKPPSDSVPPAPPQLERCTVCGTANEVTRTFCMKCGSALPKSEAPAYIAAGTVSGAQVATARADKKPANLRPLAYLVGGLLIFLVFVGLAFLALGGLNGAATAPTGSPLRTLVAAGPTASASGIDASPLESIGAITTAVPGTNNAAPSPATSSAATAPPTASAPGVSCETSHLDAAVPGGWKISSLTSSRTAQADRLSVHMNPTAAAGTAAVDAVLMAPADVQATVGVPGPASGNVALVLSFNEAVALSFDTTLDAGYRALKEASLWRHAGRAYLVAGINGNGCFDLASAGWSTGAAEATTLDVDIER